MWRVIWQPALLFLTPFIGYAVLLILRRTAPFSSRHWTQGTISILTLAGLAAAIAFMLTYGLLVERHKGTYVPAHIENGRLVPGRME